MGLKFRKSIKIAPGVRMNLSSKSVGLSVGGKGARYSVNSSGRRTTTVGIPGSGLSYSHTSGGRKKGRGKAAAPARTGHGFWWWLFIGWWWWCFRIVLYELPKLIIVTSIKLVKFIIRKIEEAQQKNAEKPEA